MFKKIKSFFSKLFNNVGSSSQIKNIIDEIKSHEDDCTKSIEALIKGDSKFKDLTQEQKQAMIHNCVQTFTKATGVIKDLSTLQADIKDHNYVKLVQDLISKYGK